ncbi:hypothetical protein F2Q70_00005960 [Brassica cretica]|uniref:Uncharacterized protein n=1 Tax=Brassica cretica TaxID=69181 RepID=A0A8S9IZ44_BRACR|nr:hypothetical protein F2Q70_00005960 [Brassica cretica]
MEEDFVKRLPGSPDDFQTISRKSRRLSGNRIAQRKRCTPKYIGRLFIDRVGIIDGLNPQHIKDAMKNMFGMTLDYTTSYRALLYAQEMIYYETETSSEDFHEVQTTSRKSRRLPGSPTTEMEVVWKTSWKSSGRLPGSRLEDFLEVVWKTSWKSSSALYFRRLTYRNVQRKRCTLKYIGRLFIDRVGIIDGLNLQHIKDTMKNMFGMTLDYTTSYRALLYAQEMTLSEDFQEVQTTSRKSRRLLGSPDDFQEVQATFRKSRRLKWKSSGRLPGSRLVHYILDD